MNPNHLSTFRLPIRYYQAWPARDPKGFVQEELELSLAETCFIELHCWNSGWPEGPSLPSDKWAIHYGVPQGVEDGCETVVRDIIQTRIVPAMAAARTARLAVFHVQPRYIAEKYPQAQYRLEPETKERPIPPALPDWHRQYSQRIAGFGIYDWKGREEMDIAPPVKPQDGDYVIITGEQFDRVLRELGVKNLIYTGFHTNWCIPHSPAAMREMSLKYGYRTILLRDCTLAIEHADTLPERTLTQASVREIEMQVGPSALATDFIAACKASATETIETSAA